MGVTGSKRSYALKWCKLSSGDDGDVKKLLRDSSYCFEAVC